MSDLLGRERVAAHHGSLSKERRFDAELRLKSGALTLLVATSSLELGIDVGEIDLVCQLGSTRSIAAFLQRAGRAGHSVDGVPKARLFPLTREELVECAALLDAIRRGELDRLAIAHAPLDVLAQQIVAETATCEWGEDALFDLVRRAWGYRDLERADFDAVVRALTEGFASSRGRRSAWLHHDAVNRVLRTRKGAGLAALTSGGTIPDNADYDVVLEPAGHVIGTVNEDFAVESLTGDVFQLGNAAYRIRRVEAGRVRVEDATGQSPNIPFWLGEAPGRSDELSVAVSRVRSEIEARLASGDASAWLQQDVGLDAPCSQQLVDFLAAGRNALGVVPTQACIVLERFFDESGGMQLVLHAPFGSRLNRAWGLALRKRFCRRFDIELQAAATEDAILLSLLGAHSFDLGEVVRYLNAASVEQVLVQALLDAPMFVTRWRWVASTSLALPRFRGGRRVAPQLQRMGAEDLLSAVFPDQIACAENIVGEREIPDHPLVRQAMDDCLQDAMDCAGLVRVLRAIEDGRIRVVARDLTLPSAFALGVLTARPYAFLDDAPLEERRAQAVSARRWLDPDNVDDLGRLDPAAIEQVRDEAWPDAAGVDEMHDALDGLGLLSAQEAQSRPSWPLLLAQLADDGRATRARCADTVDFWTTTERLPELLALFPQVRCEPAVTVPPAHAARRWTREEALREIVRSRLECIGPVDATSLARTLSSARADIEGALLALEAEGFVLAGRFSADAAEREWCERRLLARIHRYTVGRLRREIEPVSTGDLMRFLCRWQRVEAGERGDGPDALATAIAQLEGFAAPVGAWETEILPARMRNYDFTWLDELCRAGRVVWQRRAALESVSSAPAGPRLRAAPIVLLARRHAPIWQRLQASDGSIGTCADARAQRLLEVLDANGASYFDEIVESCGLLRAEAEDALARLVAAGLVHCDTFAGLRALLTPSSHRSGRDAGRGRRGRWFAIDDAGRWARVTRSLPVAATAPLPASTPARLSAAPTGRAAAPASTPAVTSARPAGAELRDDALEHVARVLLRRYGVLFWRLLRRELDDLPPWRDLVRVLRRLEARGEIRGGRFVADVPGEQYALPEAVAALRAIRREAPDGSDVVLSAIDPLNLSGVLVPGPLVPAVAGNRLLLRDGAVRAVLVAGKVRMVGAPDPAAEAAARDLLARRPAGVPRLPYPRTSRRHA